MTVPPLRNEILDFEQSCFAQALQTRFQQAMTEGRLGSDAMADIERPRPAAAQADRNLPQAHTG